MLSSRIVTFKTPLSNSNFTPAAVQAQFADLNIELGSVIDLTTKTNPFYQASEFEELGIKRHCKLPVRNGIPTRENCSEFCKIVRRES